jgi:hypothetical protein
MSGRPQEVVEQNLEWRMNKGRDIVWSRRQTFEASCGGSFGVGKHAMVLGGAR